MNKKILILYIVSTLKNTGPTNQLYEIISHLNKELFQAMVLTLSPEPADSQLLRYQQTEIIVQSLNLNRFQFILGGKKRLLKIISVINPDIIHTCGIRADYAITKLGKFKGIHCLTIRNYVYDDYIRQYGKVLGIVMANKHIKAIKYCQYPISCSNSLAAIYSNKLQLNTLSIQNGVDCYRYLRSPNNVKNIDKVTFVMCGALIKRKDPLTVIRAFNMSYNKENAELLILGVGPCFNQCKAEACHSIKFLGNVHNVSDYLKKADYIISAAVSEGLPNSILEAGASGAGLILSDIPQHCELIDKMQPNSYHVFSIGEVCQLTEIINLCMDNAKHVPHVYIANYFKENFDSSIMSKKYEELYNTIMYKGQ